MKWISRSMIVLLVAIAAWSGLTLADDTISKPVPVPMPPSRQNFRDRYSVLSDQNMFLRDRRRSRRDSDSSSYRPRTYTRRDEEYYALRGVVFEEGEYRAYMENMSKSSMLRLRVGDTIAHGKISDIQMDAIEYEQEGQHTWVDVGRNLTGAMATTAPSSQPSDLPSGISSTQPINPDDPNLTIEQKMKLRRLQQLGGAK